MVRGPWRALGTLDVAAFEAEREASGSFRDLFALIDAAHARSPTVPLAPILLLGPAGAGKTFIAQRVAEILGAPHRTIDMTSLQSNWVAHDTPLARQQLKEAQAALQGAGAVAEIELVAGEPQQVLPELVKRQAPALLVMGAFGHSRLRQLLVGSTTNSLLRLSDVPVLILR